MRKGSFARTAGIRYPSLTVFEDVLVSIQSLILVPDPYFNEPGFEKTRNTPSGVNAAKDYDANIRQATVRWAMLEHLRNPSPCFEDVISAHFWMKRGEILEQVKTWVKEAEAMPSASKTSRLLTSSMNAAKMIRRHYTALKEEFSKMAPYPGLENLAVDTGSPLSKDRKKRSAEKRKKPAQVADASAQKGKEQEKSNEDDQDGTGSPPGPMSVQAIMI
ncbi:unnamed protein product [Notodromas monacha]|uniref:Uncharacterized protein n=1 Tax=Notodromas monacha TaxID=399045 RepID=A0A7R9BFV9_9CRUS|nr:unnamed protein product [Notodromas monacha]CAG0913395.1 unnamed protein product [Notodromas monacha]